MRILLTTALAVCFIPAVRAADIENPFKNAKVGEWTEYKMNLFGSTATMKMKVLAKDDKEATYELTGTISIQGNQTPIPAQKQTVDLTKPYDLLSATMVKGKNLKVEQDSDGAEKIKLGDKEFDTKWIKLKINATVGVKPIASEVKVWLSKEVPVTGIVKLEVMSGGMTVTTMELTASGSK